MSVVEVHLVYDAGAFPALLARSRNQEALRLVRTIVLEEAQERVDACRVVDESVLVESEEANLERLRKVLAALLPDAEEVGAP